MMERLKLGTVALALGALLMVPGATAELEAQEASSRFQVLVPDMEPAEGLNRRFGERVARNLRDMIGDLDTHRAVEDRDLRDALRQFGVDRDDLNCIMARQLATQMQVELVMCGSYQQAGDGQVEVNATFVSAETGEAFDVDPFTIAEREEEPAAQQIFDSFEGYVGQLRFAAFCQDYFGSEQYEDALRNCDQAIELNPTSVSSRFVRGRIYMETDRLEESLAEFQRVLELDPISESALQNAGFVSAQLGLQDEARQYYREYLDLNPGNAAVRMREAYNLAQAGDPEGAMGFIQDGLDLDPENIDLWVQYGNFAFAAAVRAASAAQMADGDANGVTPEVAELYRQAAQAYETVFEARGEETAVSQLRNTVSAYMQLEELERAVNLASSFLEAHGEDGPLWSIYADALQRNGQADEALAALDRVLQLEPDRPNVRARKGRILIDEGRFEEAVPVLRAAVEEGGQPAEAMANLLFSEGYTNGFQQQNFNHAVELFQLAKSFPVNAATMSQYDFWLGYTHLQQGIAAQEPQTLQSAQASLPLFQRAQPLLQGGQAYAATQSSINLNQFLEAVNTYVEIQEAIIRRGR